jgi:hypothetical protein
MVINFLHVNGENYFVTICLSKIVAAITASKNLARMGRKFCLFVYYVEMIDTELWMVEEGVALNGDLEIWRMEGKIKRGIRKQCKQVFLLS